MDSKVGQIGLCQNGPPSLALLVAPSLSTEHEAIHPRTKTQDTTSSEESLAGVESQRNCTCAWNDKKSQNPLKTASSREQNAYLAGAQSDSGQTLRVEQQTSQPSHWHKQPQCPPACCGTGRYDTHPGHTLAKRPIHTLSNMLLILKEGWRSQRLTHTCEDMRGRTVQTDVLENAGLCVWRARVA